MILALSVVALLFVAAAVLYLNMQRKEQLVAPLVDQFFSRLNATQYPEIYQDATENFRKTAPVEVWGTYMKDVKDSLGSYNGRSFQHAFVTDDADLGFAEVEYRVQFSYGTIPVTFLLMKDGAIWKLSAVYFSSGKVKTSLVCPHCGEMIRYFRAECSKCGMNWRP